MTNNANRFDPELDVAYRNGERVSAEMIETLAIHAERSGPPVGLIPGGKSLSGGRAHSPKIQVVLSIETAQRVRDRAEAEHMSVSRWVRRLIEQEVATQPQ